MILFRVLYRSRATAPFSYANLTALQAAAAERNGRDDLSGLLCYSGGHFLQCLEGPRGAVNRTLCRIYRDPRHTDLVLLEAGPAGARAFADWGMKLIPPGGDPGDVFLRLFAAALGEDVAGLIDANRLLGFLTRPEFGARGRPAPATHG